MAASDYTRVDDISDRLSYTFPDGFSTTSNPSRDRVSKWIEEASAKLNNTLNAAGITTPVTNNSGRIELGVYISNYVEGRIRQFLAAAGGDGDNDDGIDLIQSLFDVCEDIRNNQPWWADKLASGSGGVRQLFGTPTDDIDGRPIIAFAPEFTRKDKF